MYDHKQAGEKGKVAESYIHTVEVAGVKHGKWIVFMLLYKHA